VKTGNNESQNNSATSRVDPLSILLLALWFGIVFGAIEVVLLGVLKVTGFFAAQGNSAVELGWRTGFTWLSTQVIWMTPVTTVFQLSLIATGLVVLSRIKPQVVTLLNSVVVLTFVAFMSLIFVYQRLYDFAVVILSAGLAVQTGRMIGARASGFLRMVRRSTVWMVAAVVMLALGLNLGAVAKRAVSVSRLPEAEGDAPNILLLILDTVRAQNVSVNGYSRETTPNLNQLAQQGVVFDRAIATAPWTLPSHVSIMTGRLPGETSTSFIVPYDGEFPTLAEVLKELGYETAAFVANRLYLGYETGINRGFQRYDDYSVSLSEFLVSSGLGRRVVHSPTVRRFAEYYDIPGRKRAGDVTEDFLRWFDRRSGEHPFFAFLNYNDAHEPYLPPSPFEDEFGEPFERRNDRSLYEMRRVVRTDRTELSPEGIQAEVDAYDGAINYIDAQIGVLLERMRRDGTLENTVVIVASDHGEHFGEHGLHVHGNSVFLPVLHVPMLMVHGDRIPAGTRVQRPVSIREIPVTALDLSGVDTGEQFPGTSLARYWTAPTDSSAVHIDSAIVSEYTDVTGDVTAKSLVMDRYHYFWGWGLVRFVHGETGEEVWRDMRFEALYDLESDPEESRDLVPDPAMADVLANARRVMTPYLIRDRSYRNYLPDWATDQRPSRNANVHRP
jgi:arylsulfatase A-like enzyme